MVALIRRLGGWGEAVRSRGEKGVLGPPGLEGGDEGELLDLREKRKVNRAR